MADPRNPHNINTMGDWVLIRTLMEAEIDKRREKLETRLSHDDSNFERGAIDALKTVIEQIEPVATPRIEDTNHYG